MFRKPLIRTRKIVRKENPDHIVTKEPLISNPEVEETISSVSKFEN